MAYKRELIAKTKNLFNVNALTPYTPETLPEGWAGVYQGQIIARCIVGSSVANSYKTFKELCPTAIAGEQYFLHFNTNGTGGTANRIWFESSERAWINGTRLVLTETDLNSRVYFYANYPERTVATISNFQIEKGSTATDYVPYGSLTSYKKLLKVSDVCQLLDKSKYPATTTTNGVTFTNNGDGTITVSGKIASSSAGDAVYSINDDNFIRINPEHKYLGLTTEDVPSGAYIFVGGWQDNSIYHYAADVGHIHSKGFFYQTTNLNVKYISIAVGVYSYQTASYNFNAQPQLFDLTEMYGAGNEPKTVEEFRTKFPNELYDYSPRCWVKSYKTELVVNNGKTI